MELLRVAQRWGSSPRFLQLLSGGTTEDKLETFANNVIDVMCHNPLLIIGEVETVDIHTDAPSSVIWTRPNRADGHVDHRVAIPWIPSAHIATLISQRLLKVDMRLQIEFYTQISRHT